MSGFDVPEAVIRTPFEEPACHWNLQKRQEPEKRDGQYGRWRYAMVRSVANVAPCPVSL